MQRPMYYLLWLLSSMSFTYVETLKVTADVRQSSVISVMDSTSGTENESNTSTLASTTVSDTSNSHLNSKGKCPNHT